MFGKVWVSVKAFEMIEDIKYLDALIGRGRKSSRKTEKAGVQGKLIEGQ